MLNQTQLKEVETLFGLGAHLGHKKSRLHPKAKKNVYTIINGTTIIDLTQTIQQLQDAKKYLTDVATEGKIILVVGTKKVASAFIKDYCATHEIPFIATKWLPGLLTNFKTIMNNVQKLKDYDEQQKTGELNKVIKHERTKLQKEMGKLERLYGGIKSIVKRPDVLLVIDIKKEKNAIKEAQMYDIPVVAIVDTNGNPDNIAYPVVANDDDTQVVEYLMKDLLEIFVTTRTKQTEKKLKEEKK